MSEYYSDPTNVGQKEAKIVFWREYAKGFEYRLKQILKHNKPRLVKYVK